MIRCRLYSASHHRPRQVAVPTRCTGRVRFTNRYPYTECFFDNAILQPYIHNCIVNVHEGNNIYHYAFFFKRHCCLSINNSLPLEKDDNHGPGFRGDVMVMRVSKRNHNSFINMRERDTILADWVIGK
ncbi:hypothetical protein BU17DRAFT_47884 [Hysterangium stoloniferum]|nr:hypothetical protein BU17DRAFT_47884 [Hysterangium stoloniferum]